MIDSRISKNLRYSFLILIATILFWGCETEKKERFDIVVRGGNIIDLETGDSTQKDVFISDGRIKKIVNSDETDAYRADQVIDGTDKYILPGFWDNHVHFRGGDSLIDANKNFLGLFIANGITAVRDAGGDLTESVTEWKKRIADRKLAGPTIFTSGPKIDGPNPTWAGSLEVENEDDITKVLDSLQQLPVDFVKLYDSRISGENYLKTIEEAERRGLITSGHMPFTVTLDETIDAGLDAVEHLYYIMKGCSAKEAEITQQLVDKEIGFWQAMPLLRDSFQDSTARQTFKSLKENNVYVVPTLHIGNTLSYLDETDHSNDPYLKYMDKDIIKTYQGRIDRALNSSEKAISDRKELDKFFIRLTKMLSDAGVQLLAGSDSGAYNSYTYPGISLHKELEAMVGSGMSPLEAIKTSAYNGSRFLKQNGDYGTVTEGKKADLVLLDANPLEDITNTRKIYLVLKDDTLYNIDKLNKLLQESIKN